MLTNNPHNIDYLAEVIVSHLLSEKRADMASVVIRLAGVFRRFYSRDVEKIVPRSNDSSQKEWDVFVHREGLYDILPEGFFHTTSKKYFKDHQETIAEFHLHRIQEKNARQFFMPLEQEFYRHLIDKEIYEQDFYFSPESIREFMDFYNLNNLALNQYQKAALFFIMPFLSYIAGNLKLTETCFEIILQERVQIRQNQKMALRDYAGNVPLLNNSKLGFDSILGNTYSDGNSLLKIEIGPLLKSNDFMEYIMGPKRKLAEWLADLFIQADLYTEFRILLKHEDEAFVLTQRDYEGRLSYSTCI